MNPTPKSSAIATALENISGRTTAITGMKCVRAPIGCGKPVTGFNDEISQREYRISGLCQQCQDAFFK